MEGKLYLHDGQHRDRNDGGVLQGYGVGVVMCSTRLRGKGGYVFYKATG